jgi:hypothetical protein
MEPARIVPQGHIQVTGVLGGSLPAGDLLATIDDIGDIEVGPDSTLSDDAVRTLARGSAIVFIHPPGVNAHVGIAYGITRNFEIGMRGSPDAVRGWTRWQFLRVKPGIYGALGLGLGTYFEGFPVEDFTDLARSDPEVAEPYRRYEVDMPLQVGISGRSGHLWLGPKFMFADYDVAASVCGVRAEESCIDWGTMGITGTVEYFGGQIGGAIGYEQIWLAAEITAMDLSVDAMLDIDVADTREVLRYRTEGVAFSPAIGVIGWF